MNARWDANDNKLLMRAMLPNGGFVVMLAQAYFDESGTAGEDKDLCLGGYIFTSENALAIEAPWQEMLSRYGLPYFHMSECAHNIGIYAHLTKGQCDLAARDAIALVKTHAARGVAISVDKSIAAPIRASSIWKNPYSFIVGQTVHAVKSWAESANFAGDVAYQFESGASGYGQAAEALELVKRADANDNQFRVRSVSFIGKRDCAGVQCADILAWHWLQQNKRWRNGRKDKRADFKSLIQLFVDGHHYDAEALTVLEAMRAAPQSQRPA